MDCCFKALLVLRLKEEDEEVILLIDENFEKGLANQIHSTRMKVERPMRKFMKKPKQYREFVISNHVNYVKKA